MATSADSRLQSFADVVDDLRAAVADPRIGARLVLVDAAAVLTVAGEPASACTVVLRAPGAAVEDGKRPGADCAIELSPQAVQTFWERPLAMSVFAGEATIQGPARRFLAVHPVLRAFARSRREADGDRGPRT